MRRPWITFLPFLIVPAVLAAQEMVAGGRIVDPQSHPLATSEKSYSTQLSGTVVDTSGAVIAGATVLVRSANGTVQETTQSDPNGSFVISGLSVGTYRLIVSSPGFATKEMSVTIGTNEAPAPLLISLAVGGGVTTVEVKSRADDLVGIASSAGQVTVGGEELETRPILRSGEILEALPGLITVSYTHLTLPTILLV